MYMKREVNWDLYMKRGVKRDPYIYKEKRQRTTLTEETTCALVMCFKWDLYVWKDTPKETLKEAYAYEKRGDNNQLLQRGQLALQVMWVKNKIDMKRDVKRDVKKDLFINKKCQKRPVYMKTGDTTTNSFDIAFDISIHKYRSLNIYRSLLKHTRSANCLLRKKLFVVSSLLIHVSLLWPLFSNI